MNVRHPPIPPRINSAEERFSETKIELFIRKMEEWRVGSARRSLTFHLLHCVVSRFQPVKKETLEKGLETEVAGEGVPDSEDIPGGFIRTDMQFSSL